MKNATKCIKLSISSINFIDSFHFILVTDLKVGARGKPGKTSLGISENSLSCRNNFSGHRNRLAKIQIRKSNQFSRMNLDQGKLDLPAELKLSEILAKSQKAVIKKCWRQRNT
jgi:hypothetical protein